MRKDRILRHLQDGPATSDTLTALLDCPAASLRRSISELRAAGHDIAVARNGSYRINAPRPSTLVDIPVV